MEREENKNITFIEILEWRMSYSDGFYGVLKDPKGQEGFLSKSGGSSCWWPLGEGQDPDEAMKVAKALHEALNSDCIDPVLLGKLGSEVERLSNPKLQS